MVSEVREAPKVRRAEERCRPKAAELCSREHTSTTTRRRLRNMMEDLAVDDVNKRR